MQMIEQFKLAIGARCVVFVDITSGKQLSALSEVLKSLGGLRLSDRAFAVDANKKGEFLSLLETQDYLTHPECVHWISCNNDSLEACSLISAKVNGGIQPAQQM